MVNTRLALIPLLLPAALALGCSGPPTEPDTPIVERSVTAAELAQLPVDTVIMGIQVCTSTASLLCPPKRPVANRLDNGQIAIWAPGRPVGIWRDEDSVLTQLGNFGSDTTTQYASAIALRARGKGYQLIAASGSQAALLTLDDEGQILARQLLGSVGPLSIVGFVGDVIVRQAYGDWRTPARGELRITRLEQVTDSAGTDLLVTGVPWMQTGARNGMPLHPLVAASPVWALTPESGIVWSPATPFLLESRGPDGNVRWRLHGPSGPPVTALALARREAEIRDATQLIPFDSVDFVTMRAGSDSVFPAIVGIAVTPTGAILIASGTETSRDSVTYYRISSEGVPQSRFALPANNQVLLAEGDSLLVHRPSGSGSWEVIWLRLTRQ